MENREHKYRAWDAENNQMISSESMVNLTVEFDEGGELIVSSTKENGDYYELELIQFTGLKDKKGKEIYEGDILGWNYFCQSEKIKEYSIVNWEDRISGFDFGDGHRPDFCQREVIGNIYENPELINN